MKITGYKLREAIRLQKMQIVVLNGQFNGSLVQFKEDKKGDPRDIAKQLEAAELALAKLQVAQSYCNLNVQVNVLGNKMTLGDAVKRIGGIARLEEIWTKVANTEPDRYSMRHGMSRDPAQEYAQTQIDPQEALKLATGYAREAAALRAAIAEANSETIEISFLDSKLATAES